MSKIITGFAIGSGGLVAAYFAFRSLIRVLLRINIDLNEISGDEPGLSDEQMTSRFDQAKYRKMDEN